MRTVAGRRCGNRISLLASILAIMLMVPKAGTQTPVAAGEPGLEKLPVIKELPDPFRMNSGKRVSNQEDWLRRREELKEMLLYYEYGHLAPAPGESKAAEVSARRVEEFDASEKLLSLSVGADQKLSFRLILTIPSGKGPFPVVVKGDLCWGRIPASILAAAVRRGYIVAEFDRTEIAPDIADRTKGVYPLYPGNDWAALAAWAWGYHRTVDYLLTQSYVDKKRIAVTGHFPIMQMLPASVMQT